MKFFLLFLVFFTKTYANVTSMKEWEICTPKHTLHTFVKNSQKGSYQQLQILGEQANLLWSAKSKQSKSGMVEDLANIFEIVTPYFMADVIDQILADDELLTQVAAASYRNVTGFLKVVLVANGPKGWKIRLHIWKQGEKEYAHNHKWDFYSKILTGYLEQNIYEVSDIDIASGVRCKICEPVSLMPVLPTGDLPCPCRDSYSLIEKQQGRAKFGSVYLGFLNRYILGTGESYFMPNHLVHTIAPGKKAITFVFTSDQITDNSEVFVPDDINVSLQKYAPSITKSELIQELCEIKKNLQGLVVSAKYLPEMIDSEHRYYNKQDAIFSEPNWRSHFLVDAISRGKVLQLSDEHKKDYMVSVSDLGEILVGGILPVKNSQMLFVLIDGVMYASPKDFAHHSDHLICHTSFTDYAPVESAGVLHFDNQSGLKKIEAYSGHYAPTPQNMEIAINYLQQIGYNTSQVLILGYFDRI